MSFQVSNTWPWKAPDKVMWKNNFAFCEVHHYNLLKIVCHYGIVDTQNSQHKYSSGHFVKDN